MNESCSLYPAEGEFLENIRQEAIDNVKRLRNHPCIALWCGNNECNDGWFGWGWKKKYEAQNPEYAKKIWKQYTDQYYVTLPEVIKQYDPEGFYWPSSPFASADKGSDDRNGDRHYWSVWHDLITSRPHNDSRIVAISFYCVFYHACVIIIEEPMEIVAFLPDSEAIKELFHNHHTFLHTHIKEICTRRIVRSPNSICSHCLHHPYLPLHGRIVDFSPKTTEIVV